jgi:hypothetical protein
VGGRQSGWARQSWPKFLCGLMHESSTMRLELRGRLGNAASGTGTGTGNGTGSALLDDGSLVIKDSTDTVVWSSAFSPTSQSGTRAPGAKPQLQSGGSVAVSCLRADRVLPQVSLTSYGLTLGAQGFVHLQQSSTASVLWSPASTAVPGATTTSLCLAEDSSLRMSSKGLYAGSLQTTWASKHVIPQAATRSGPYTARIRSASNNSADALCGQASWRLMLPRVPLTR